MRVEAAALWLSFGCNRTAALQEQLQPPALKKFLKNRKEEIDRKRKWRHYYK
jgi:hypothetical protein